MTALFTQSARGPRALEVRRCPDPRPTEDQVLVRVTAAGVNFADVMATMGLYPDAPKLPAIMGYEIAGEVQATGAHVTKFAPGDKVFGGTMFGGHAETAIAHEDALIEIPSGWTVEEAAAFPVSYATGYAALHRFGGLREGERVLIHAAAGGVGLASTQLALAAGAEVFGTASSGKQEALRRAGVHHPIDYTRLDFVTEIRAVTGLQEPIDLAVDAIGGRSFRRTWRLLGPGGRMVCLGATSLVDGDRRKLSRVGRTLLGMPRFGALSLMRQSKAVIGLNVLRIWNAKGSLAEFITPLQDLVARQELRPVVGQHFPLERAPDAYRYVIARRNIGKVILRLAES